MLSNYARVRLMTKNFQALGANLFDVGYIIEVYPNGEYELEFSDENGTTTAQIVVREEDIQLADMEPVVIANTPNVHPGEAPKPAEPAKTIKEPLL
jgi:hypothetical protein